MAIPLLIRPPTAYQQPNSYYRYGGFICGEEWLAEYTYIKYQYDDYASKYRHERTPHRDNPEGNDIILTLEKMRCAK